MKRYLPLFLIGIFATLTFSSCSSSTDLAANDTPDNSRRYYKEYIGNRIVYHDKEEAASDNPAVDDSDSKEVSPEKFALKESLLLSEREMLASMNGMQDVYRDRIDSEVEDSEAEDTQVATPRSETKKPQLWKGLFSKLKESHENVVSGAVFTKKFHKKRKGDGSAPMGASEVFALLALIFGAASVSSIGAAAVGISFGVVAIVFALIGQDAESFWGVFSLVGLILGIVGAALSFVFIFV